MCARTCLFLWLLVTPLELLPPAGQIPLRLDGLTLAGLRKFWPASSGLRSCRTASSHGRGRAVWLDALCGRRLQHQALRCGVSTEVYAMLCYAQAGRGDAGRSSRDGYRATKEFLQVQRVSTMRRRSCRPLCGRSAWRCTALLQRWCGQQAVGELDRTHGAHGEEASCETDSWWLARRSQTSPITRARGKAVARYSGGFSVGQQQ